MQVYLWEDNGGIPGNDIYSELVLNTNDAGNTRGYNRGDRITDQSSNYGFQIQNFFDIPR